MIDSVSTPAATTAVCARKPRGRARETSGVGASNPGGDNWEVTKAFATLLERQGYDRGAQLRYIWERGAAHNEAAWRARLEHPLRWWFGR